MMVLQDKAFIIEEQPVKTKTTCAKAKTHGMDAPWGCGMTVVGQLYSLKRCPYPVVLTSLSLCISI